MSRLLSTLIILPLGLLLSWPAMAEDTQYQIEMIVFSHILAKGVSQEHWPQNYLQTPDLKNSITLQPALSEDNTDDTTDNNTAALTTTNDNILVTTEEDAQPTTLLPESDWLLKAEAARIQQHPDYHILVHIAWQQILPGSSKHPSIIHFYGGDGYNAGGNTDTLNIDESQPFDSEHNWQVNGIVQLYVNRYINSHFQIAFAMPTQQFEQLNHNPLNNNLTHNPLSYVMLNQSRRMRSNELNYIDHPLYGILVKVTPIKNSPDKQATV